MQKRIGHFSEIPAAKIDIFPREEKEFSRPLPQPRKLLDQRVKALLTRLE
jgi:hypothetical protein